MKKATSGQDVADEHSRQAVTESVAHLPVCVNLPLNGRARHVY